MRKNKHGGEWQTYSREQQENNTDYMRLYGLQQTQIVTNTLIFMMVSFFALLSNDNMLFVV